MKRCKKINENGYLTKNSQAGRKSNEYERAYIQGFMTKTRAIEFLKRMNKHFELVVFTASLSKYAEPLCA